MAVSRDFFTVVNRYRNAYFTVTVRMRMSRVAIPTARYTHTHCFQKNKIQSFFTGLYSSWTRLKQFLQGVRSLFAHTVKNHAKVRNVPLIASGYRHIYFWKQSRESHDHSGCARACACVYVRVFSHSKKYMYIIIIIVINKICLFFKLNLLLFSSSYLYYYYYIKIKIEQIYSNLT